MIYCFYDMSDSPRYVKAGVEMSIIIVVNNSTMYKDNANMENHYQNNNNSNTSIKNVNNIYNTQQNFKKRIDD